MGKNTYTHTRNCTRGPLFSFNELHFKFDHKSHHHVWDPSEYGKGFIGKKSHVTGPEKWVSRRSISGYISQARGRCLCLRIQFRESSHILTPKCCGMISKHVFVRADPRNKNQPEKCSWLEEPIYLGSTITNETIPTFPSLDDGAWMFANIE